jgi:tRNA-dihydrouridine synthase
VPDSENMESVRSEPALLLAPMEGVTDFATRFWMAQIASPDEATTPFLRVTKDYPSKRIAANFLPEIELSKEHGIVTCIPQLMASETDDLIRIGEHFLKRLPFIDINCGCPSPTVVGNGAGSSLLRCPDSFYQYLSKIVTSLGPARVSVKMRIGFQAEEEFHSLLQVVKSFPLARLTIHGRTRADRYKGKARWQFINEASTQLNYPVVGSGDVVDEHSLKERLAIAPHVSGVMIGRGALRNPWIFDSVRDKKAAPEKISFDLLVNRIHQFCLFQEFNCHHWTTFFELIQSGFFSTSVGHDADLLREQNAHAASIIFACQPTERTSAHLWPLGRVSVARGKMLWNYLRSGVGLDALHSIQILRAQSWPDFVESLGRLKCHFPENQLRLSYHPDWDWIYAGEPQKSLAQEGRHESAR